MLFTGVYFICRVHQLAWVQAGTLTDTSSLQLRSSMVTNTSLDALSVDGLSPWSVFHLLLIFGEKKKKKLSSPVLPPYHHYGLNSPLLDQWMSALSSWYAAVDSPSGQSWTRWCFSWAMPAKAMCEVELIVHFSHALSAFVMCALVGGSGLSILFLVNFIICSLYEPSGARTTTKYQSTTTTQGRVAWGWVGLGFRPT